MRAKPARTRTHEGHSANAVHSVPLVTQLEGAETGSRVAGLGHVLDAVPDCNVDYRPEWGTQPHPAVGASSHSARRRVVDSWMDST
jgi:hypothetical protein